MPTKRLYILANSVKNSQHCIAGRELIDDRGKLAFGGWVRPVSRHGEGELSWNDCRFPDGNTPAIGDVVDIPLLGYAESAAQPENWIMDPKTTWRKVVVDPEILPNWVVDSPSRLWMAIGERADRISPAALAKLKSPASLYLIRATRFRVHLGWREWEGKQSKRRRALFDYRGTSYDFSLTDPEMDRFCVPFPTREEGERTVFLPGDGDYDLCVSLSAPFNGYHYKIVATVLGL